MSHAITKHSFGSRERSSPLTTASLTAQAPDSLAIDTDKTAKLKGHLRALVVLLCITATLTAGSAVYMIPGGPSFQCSQGTTWVGSKPVYTSGQISVNTALRNELYVDQIAVMDWSVYRRTGTKWERYSYGSQILYFKRSYWNSTYIQLPVALPSIRDAGHYTVYLTLTWTENGAAKTSKRWLQTPGGADSCYFQKAG